MSQTNHTPADKEAAARVDGPGHVDQIRDILFGGQMRDYDKRFAQLEERVANENEQLRSGLEERIKAVQEQANASFAQLLAQLRNEKAERVDLGKEIGRDLKEAGKGLERTIEELRNASEALRKEALKNAASELKELRDEVRAEREGLAAAIEQQFAEFADAKADREAVADLFSEMALRLRGQAGNKSK